MMQRDTTNKAYDLGLEILCDLEPPPGYVLFSNLMRDFNLPDQQELRREIANLQLRFSGLKIVNVRGKGRALTCSRTDWAMIEQVANDYWHRMQLVAEPETGG
ncbi:hypothetical protein LCGC14_1504650 [marine sediment metagenome]|uniref:Uncharacterized protein n=1 Tax=marine sediment metagenome TaxID=412755 RepID=A0A0F9J3H3_9ZZZZ